MSLLDLIKSPQAMERTEWAAVLHALTQAHSHLCTDGVKHTWLDGAIGIAQERSQGKGTYAPLDPATHEPDWTDSETDPGKLWKNTTRTIQDRLRIADEAIANRDRIIANLRAQLAGTAAPEYFKLAPVAATKEIIHAIEATIENQITASGMTEEMHRLDGQYVWDAAIAAVENK